MKTEFKENFADQDGVEYAPGSAGESVKAEKLVKYYNDPNLTVPKEDAEEGYADQDMKQDELENLADAFQRWEQEMYKLPGTEKTRYAKR